MWTAGLQTSTSPAAEWRSEPQPPMAQGLQALDVLTPSLLQRFTVPTADVPCTPTSDDHALYPRQVMAPPEAAVLICLILSVTLLTWFQRPIPAVMTVLCAGAAALLIPLRGI